MKPARLPVGMSGTKPRLVILPIAALNRVRAAYNELSKNLGQLSNRRFGKLVDLRIAIDNTIEHANPPTFHAEQEAKNLAERLERAVTDALRSHVPFETIRQMCVALHPRFVSLVLPVFMNLDDAHTRASVQAYQAEDATEEWREAVNTLREVMRPKRKAVTRPLGERDAGAQLYRERVLAESTSEHFPETVCPFNELPERERRLWGELASLQDANSELALWKAHFKSVREDLERALSLPKGLPFAMLRDTLKARLNGTPAPKVPSPPLADGWLASSVVALLLRSLEDFETHLSHLKAMQAHVSDDEEDTSGGYNPIAVALANARVAALQLVGLPRLVAPAQAVEPLLRRTTTLSALLRETKRQAKKKYQADWDGFTQEEQAQCLKEERGRLAESLAVVLDWIGAEAKYEQSMLSHAAPDSPLDFPSDPPTSPTDSTP